ncbi:MAG: 50S ribosomal protein L23 [Candidatus Paceibacterota bacterium]
MLLKPRITEKSSLAAGERAYTFQVHPDATKSMVKKAIEEVYKLHPVKVNIIVSKPKKIRVRGRVGTKSGRKQAIVYLKKGDKIEFV